MAHIQLLGASITLVLLLTSLTMAIPVPSEKQHVISLDGAWRFKLERPASATTKPAKPGARIPPDYPATFESFHALDYQEDGNWHDLTVPSNWEMAGFSVATYNQPDNASGFYRKWFDVPADWQGRRVLVNFDGVQNGAEVFCNGQPVKVDEPSWGRENYHEGGWTAFQADLTPVAKFGAKNLLAIRVTKNTKSSNLDTGDYFFLGGVHRPVTLFSVPTAHIRDIAVRTKLLPDNKAEIKLIANIEGASPKDVLSAKLEDLSSPEAEIGETGRVELTQIVANPKLWSAEFPNLYTFTIDLKDASGRTIQRIIKRIGIRQVTIDNGIFKINGVPVKLAGICRHDVYPTLGTAIDEEVWRKDITMMKAANFNAIRTSHYPYGSGFYDLCDELGMYVADELPYCWCDTGDPALTPAFEQRAREAVQRDLNHPCVVIWAIGNENKAGINNLAASKVVEAMDPTRPRLSSCHPAEEANTQFDDAHYVPPAEIAQNERDTTRRSKFPKIYLESPNTWDNRLGADYGCLDLWVLTFDRTWKEIWDADHTPGCFLWEWQDRAVADKATTKPYYYEPETGIHFLKTKGIVDGFRNPRPHYYHCKMVLTPIKLDEHLEAAASSITLHAANHYSFTDLSQLQTRWQLLAAEKEIRSGTGQLTLAPRTRGDLQLPLPQDSLAAADTLRLDFIHPDGRNIATYQFGLKPAADSTPSIDSSNKAICFPQLNLITAKNTPDGIDWHTCTRTHYRLSNIILQKATGSPANQRIENDALLATPLSDVRAIDADIVAESDAKPFGNIHVDYSAGKFSYRLIWRRNDRAEKPDKSGEKPEKNFDVQEFGWIFQGAATADRFSWDRKAYWSWYPKDHIGRTHGTATPDSAAVHNTNLTRLDAFDFNSTKYNCKWASLTDSAGAGLCTIFSLDDPHQCKAATDNSGAHQFIINKHVSPPRDLSSNIVIDCFLTLGRNSQVQGSFRIGTVQP